jgi:hypothetical protein
MKCFLMKIVGKLVATNPQKKKNEMKFSSNTPEDENPQLNPTLIQT